MMARSEAASARTQGAEFRSQWTGKKRNHCTILEALWDMFHSFCSNSLDPTLAMTHKPSIVLRRYWFRMEHGKR